VRHFLLKVNISTDNTPHRESETLESIIKSTVVNQKKSIFLNALFCVQSHIATTNYSKERPKKSFMVRNIKEIFIL